MVVGVWLILTSKNIKRDIKKEINKPKILIEQQPNRPK